MLRLFILLVLVTVFTLGCQERYPVYNDPIPAHDSLIVSSKFVSEDRVINVWTPPEYENTSDSFPVLYMPDGGVKEDFPHIANTLAALIDSSLVPPFILVGIENTERARDMTGASSSELDKSYELPLEDGAKNFRAFITEELMPEINSKYRTTDKKGIIGESLAGLFVVESFFLQATDFDFYIAMDPSIWWNDGYIAENATQLLADTLSQNTKLWFVSSAVEDIQVYTNKLAKALKEKDVQNLTWNYSVENEEQHSTIYRATKKKAMIWSLNN